MIEGPAARIGVISDTHGLLPGRVLDLLAGVDAIVHAGDVDAADVLHVLATVAPVTAVRGNCDTGPEVRRLPVLANVVLGGVRFLVAHHARDLVAPMQAGGAPVDVAVSGHTHVPSVETRDGVLWLNPGSVTAPRDGSSASLAIVTVDTGGAPSAELVPLV